MWNAAIINKREFPAMTCQTVCCATSPLAAQALNRQTQ